MLTHTGSDIRQRLLVEDLDRAKMMIRICAFYEAPLEIYKKKCRSLDLFQA